VSAPSGLAASAQSQSQINLSWGLGQTGVRTEIYRNGASIGWAGAGGVLAASFATATTDATSLNNTGLSSNTTYTYRVRHQRVSDNVLSDLSNDSTVTTQTPPPPAATPHSCTATALGYYSIRVGWQNAATQIEYGTDPALGSFSTYTADLTTPADITGLADGTTYYFRARNASGVSNIANATTDVYFSPDPEVGCVVYGSMVDVLFSNGWTKIPARQVLPGTVARSIDQRTGEYFEGTVKSVHEAVASRVYSIVTETGQMVQCSSSHPLITEYGDMRGKAAHKFRTGDSIMVYDYAQSRAVVSKVSSWEYIDKETPVLIFEMENIEHTFISDGVVSHNIEQKV
jgi:hypothetical protein